MAKYDILSKPKNKKGFTLVELVAVVTILSLLATMAMTQVSSYTRKAKASADVESARVIHDAAQRAVAEGKIAPPTVSYSTIWTCGVNETITDNACWFKIMLDGGYLSSIPDIKALSGVDRTWLLQIYKTGVVEVGVLNEEPTPGTIGSAPKLFPKPGTYSGGMFETSPYTTYKLLN